MMKKNELVEVIEAMGQEAMGELTHDDLVKMNIGQLKALKKELDEEAKSADTPEPVEVTPEPVEEKTRISLEKLPVEVTPEPVFVSMCGELFDPKKAGTCYKQCSVDFPEAFASCEAHFKTKPVGSPVGEKTKRVAKAKNPSGGGRTLWNHVANSQAGKIDECIVTGHPMTIKEIASYAMGKEARCLHHLKHLVADWNVDILHGNRTEGELTEVVYFWADKNPDMPGTALVRQ
jgi:hypothetical protein